MTSTLKAALAAVLILAPGLAAAQQQHQHGAPAAGPAAPAPGQGMNHGPMNHGAMNHGAMAKPKGDSSPSSFAFQGINAKMHEEMDITYTGNADVDFVRGMIPHHQGAVDMAKTVLAFGKDPEIRKLAEGIVKAQEDEIAQLKAWLAKNAR